MKDTPNYKFSDVGELSSELKQKMLIKMKTGIGYVY